MPGETMDFTLDDVRSTLGELGYGSVPPDQLKDFAKDLKRLVKHEERSARKRETSRGAAAATTPPGRISEQQPCSNDAENCQPKVVDQNLAQAAPKEQPPPLSRRTRNMTAREWNKLKSDPVRLYHWYKTFWDIHHLK